PSGASLGSSAPMNSVVETFTEAERARLAPHFTNLDRPVFALTNLPETVKGALFARYSRYPGTLRRLFLDEFAESLPDIAASYDDAEGERAAKLYETIFLGYGDDSVAQLGGAHVACEWVSNVLTKVLQRPRLGAYLEQSTRYIAYDAPMPGGGYRYHRDAAAARWGQRLGLHGGASDSDRPSVRLLHVDGDEDALLAALLFEAAGCSEEEARIRLSALSGDERATLLADLVGARANRRHR